MTQGKLPISVALPTLGREEVLVETLRQLLSQIPAASEILVLDQTTKHKPATEKFLNTCNEDGKLRWVRFGPPSQPAALNRGLLLSTQPFVLFLDDDILIEQGFIASHYEAYENSSIWAVAGQVLQPNEIEDPNYSGKHGKGPFADSNFSFRYAEKCEIENGMSGNLSVRRNRAIEIGGFDENFLPPVSYRFDNEFCKRLCSNGGKIVFEPSAKINHLRAKRGGTRSAGSHLTSASPIHGVGDYYFALRQPWSVATLVYVLRRPFREISTRFHLKNPWFIPVKFLGEIRAILLACRLAIGGPKLIDSRNRP